MDYHILNFLKLIPDNKVITYKDISNIFGIYNVGKFIQNFLQKNNLKNEKNLFFKVVNNDGIIKEKDFEAIKALKNVKIPILNNKILNLDYFSWKPNITNIFIAIDLDEKSKEILFNVQKNISQEFSDLCQYLSFQNADTSHITLLFLGNVFEKMKDIINKFKELNIDSKYNFVFDKIDFFGPKRSRKVMYFTSSYESVINSLNDLYNYIFDIFSVFVEKSILKKDFVPHITIARIKKPYYFLKMEKRIILLLKKYNIFIPELKISIYATIDAYKQVKLITL